jgi:hypothetical protein
MHFNDESQAVAIEVLTAVSSRLTSAINATRNPLPGDDQARIEALQDRLIGLRETVININDALQALLRLAQEDA